MLPRKSPRLRTVEKVKPAYHLNKFPQNFGFKIGREIVYLLTTKGYSSLEGPEWEQIFADCLGAEWKPSNVGLDDIVLEGCAWGAKSVKSIKPSSQKKVRLISGRNSPKYSYGTTEISQSNPNELGRQILEIWNERVSAIKKNYKYLRTVVLIKSKDLSEVFVFEFETIRYDPALYVWNWNKRGNLEGFAHSTLDHKFTWQPHGSQFTILEDVPNDGLLIKIKVPEKLDKEKVLKSIGFNKNWVTVIKRK